jgi:transmembrane sensor
MVQAEATGLHMQSLSGEEMEQRLSWRSGLVVFRATPLAEAVAQFNRYNKRKIVLADPSIAALGVGGVFRATDQEVFLKLLETGFPVRAELREHEVLLHPRL